MCGIYLARIFNFLNWLYTRVMKDENEMIDNSSNRIDILVLEHEGVRER